MYALWIVSGLLVCSLIFARRLGGGSHSHYASLLTMTLSAVLSVVAAKLFYVLLIVVPAAPADGLEALFYPEADTFSVFGGGVGVLVGAWLSARLIKAKPAFLLDQFIPCAAVFLAFLRAAEKELGTIGVGGYVQSGSPLACFPFSVPNVYGEQLYALFYLEALLALLCGLVFLLCRRQWPDGVRSELCLFFLALPQIICESLRSRCMKWGFVRTEQLLCGLLLLGLLGYACKKASGMRRYRYMPLLLGVLCIVCIGLLEYGLYKSGIPVWLCYSMMAVLLGCMAWLEAFAVKRRAD